MVSPKWFFQVIADFDYLPGIFGFTILYGLQNEGIPAADFGYVPVTQGAVYDMAVGINIEKLYQFLTIIEQKTVGGIHTSFDLRYLFSFEARFDSDLKIKYRGIALTHSQ